MRDSPSAELTMLFTDIEGSTRLLNRLGPAFADVLAAHRRILRHVFQEFAGRELGTEGDSFFVVFDDAGQAVGATVEGQLGLERHPWPEGVRLRVRMGLHTGTPEVFEDNLTGWDVHLAARIAATGHGGQVVISGATAERVAGSLPKGVSLVSLGAHRLKDIPDPQRLLQLVVPGMPSTFPPLRSLGGPGSLPVPPTPFVGREVDVEALVALFDVGGSRVVTLTGPGGAGKTRLSLAVAQRLTEAYPDGVHFVDLASTRDEGVAWTTTAEVLGRSGEGRDGLVDHLSDQRVLLVLDTLEQLPRSGADLVAGILGGTRHLRVLATSRRPLHVAGEQVYPVPPLDVPEAGRVTTEQAEGADAVRMFVQQARLSDPGFTLTEDNVADVVALCRRLDGLPLALELAAAQIRLLPPRLLLDHVDEALSLPGSGHPDRQSSLAATVAWSYGMVGEDEQRAFRAISVFGAAGGSFEAFADVLRSDSVLAPVAGLLDAALIRVDDDPAGARVRALQTVRAVAGRLLAESDDLDDVQRRHAVHYVELAERTAPMLKGPGAMAARALIERELGNFRAALDWTLGSAHNAVDESRLAPADASIPGEDDRTALGIRLCTALGWYWYQTGYDSESRRWLEQASRSASHRQGPDLAKLLHNFGLLQLQHGNAATARDVLAKSLVLWRRIGNRTEECVALNSLGVAYRALGDSGRALELLTESLTVARLLNNMPRQATALNNIALLKIDTGDPKAAIVLLEDAERIDTLLGDEWGVAADRSTLAGALLAAVRTPDAIGVLRQLAPTVEDQGDLDLTLAVVELLAVAAALTGDHSNAVRLAANAAEHRARGDVALAEPDRLFLERRLAPSREAVGAGRDAIEAEGRALDPHEALALVSTLRSPLA